MYIGSGEDVENQQEYIITLCLNKALCGNRKGKKNTPGYFSTLKDSLHC